MAAAGLKYARPRMLPRADLARVVPIADSSPAAKECLVTSVLVRYFAAARAAAGLSEERVDLEPAATVGDLKARLQALHGQDLTRVLAVCSLLVDGTAVREDAASLAEASGVDVLPPFAGG